MTMTTMMKSMMQVLYTKSALKYSGQTKPTQFRTCVIPFLFSISLSLATASPPRYICSATLEHSLSKNAIFSLFTNPPFLSGFR
ncbi:hypothetical protein EUGRSUZ_J00066 [Eucalyptus grandis]|uniref:Uncharacterized protein n=2 Tax=Eucalyptus grandis TaxID=71139 RepID=A0ACC3J1E5_EUCGR|nr:hypothetical protein EUGRSUZ_J00066 [Eucalyptus grandis]